MKFPLLVTFAVPFFLLPSCKEEKDNGKTFNPTYVTGTVPDLADFLKYTPQEHGIDSINSRYDKGIDSFLLSDTGNNKNKWIKKKDFRNNRARLLIQAYKNGMPDSGNGTLNSETPTECACFIDKDSLFITMGTGFFGGFGFTIDVSDKNFQSGFIYYTDDVKPFKSSLTDTAFSEYAIVKNKYQYLILDRIPDFKPGQQLTGYLVCQSNDYYEKADGGKLDTNYVTGKIYFACKTKQKTE